MAAARKELDEQIEQIEQFADVLIMLNHHIVVERLPASGLAQDLFRRVDPEVHPGGVEPDKEGLIVLMRLSDEALGLR